MTTVVQKQNRTLEFGTWLTLAVLTAMGSAAKTASGQANGPISFGNNGCRLNLPQNCTVNQAKQQLEDGTTTTLQKGNAVIRLGDLGQRDASVLPYLIDRFALEIKNGVPEHGDSLDQYEAALNLLAYQNPKSVESAFSNGSKEANQQFKNSQHILFNHEYLDKNNKKVIEPVMAPETVEQANLKNRAIALQRACSEFKAKNTTAPAQTITSVSPPVHAQTAPTAQAPTPGKKPNAGVPAAPVAPQAGPPSTVKANKPADTGTQAQAAPQNYPAGGVTTDQALLILSNRLKDATGKGDKTAVTKAVQALVTLAKQPGGKGASEILMKTYGEQDYLFRSRQATGRQANDPSVSTPQTMAAIIEKGLKQANLNCTSFGVGRDYLIRKTVDSSKPPIEAFGSDIDELLSGFPEIPGSPGCHILFQTQNGPDFERMPLDQVASILQNDDNTANRADAAKALGHRGNGNQNLLIFLAGSLSNEIKRGAPKDNEADPFSSIVTVLQEQGSRQGQNDPGDVGPALFGASKAIYNILKGPTVRNPDGSLNASIIHWQDRLNILDEAMKNTPKTCDFKAGIEIFEIQTVRDGSTPQRVFAANLLNQPTVGIPKQGCHL